MSLVQAVLQLAHSDLEKISLEHVEGFPCHSYIKDSDGGYLSCSDAQARAVRLTSSNDLIGLTDFDVLSNKDAQTFRKNDKRVMLTDQPLITTERFTTFDGVNMIATSIKTPLRAKTKKVIGVIGLSILQEEQPLELTDNEFNLTLKQMDCLYHLAKGYTYKEIAKRMHLSPRTIEHYLESIKQKLNCRRRSDIISKALSIPYIQKKI